MHVPTRSRNTAPIHTWVLALLVAICLAFGLSPFFGEALSRTDAEKAGPAAGPGLRPNATTVGVGLAAGASLRADPVH
jgi:hypothetical protein